MGWSILRPHHFMQNLLGQAEYIIKEGPISSASGNGKIPYIDYRDIAAVAFVTLTQTGTPQQEICPDRQRSDVLPAGCRDHRAALGKPVRFVDESPDEARARRVREGMPPAVIERFFRPER